MSRYDGQILTPPLDVFGIILAEATTTELSKVGEPEIFEGNRQVAVRGGTIAGNARKEIEADTGRPVIASKNAFEFTSLLDSVIEDVGDEKGPDSGEGEE